MSDEKIFREFSFELTDEERIQRSRELVSFIRCLDDLLKERKDSMAIFKERIEEYNVDIHLAADQLEIGVVKRQIECGWKTDPFNRTIRRLIRLDTNETVEVDEIKGENLFGGQTTAQET